MPILNQTYFNVNTDDSKTIKKLNVILNTYDYEANKEYFNSLSSAMTFEYRISFCGEYSSDYSISNIDNTPSKINEKTDNLFDIYSNKTYILYLITYGIFNLISLILLFFSESLFNNKNENSSYNSTIFILTKTGIISIIIGIFSIIGIYLSILLCSTVPTLNILSYLNYYGFILGAIELIIVLITSLFKRKKIISKI